MKQVKVNVDTLLTKMRDNLAQHKNDVEELLKERRAQIEDYYGDVLSKMGRDETFQPSGRDFPMPEDNSASYERAIEMANMSVEKEITLSESEFDQLVMDNWHWKHELIRTSAFYGKALK